MSTLSPSGLYKICLPFLIDHPKLLNDANDSDLKQSKSTSDHTRNLKQLQEFFNDQFSLIRSQPDSPSESDRHLPLKKRIATRELEGTIDPKKACRNLSYDNNNRPSENEKLILDYQQQLQPPSSPPLINTANLNAIDDRAYYDFSPGVTSAKRKPYYPFFCPNGLCHGEVLYFAHQLFKLVKQDKPKTLQEFENIIIKISMQFSKGGPLPSAVLQAIDLDAAYKALGMNAKPISECDFEPTDIASEVMTELELEDLSAGTYYAYLGFKRSSHAIVLLKVSNTKGFIIDLNIGPKKFNIIGRDFVSYLNKNFPKRKIEISLYKLTNKV